MKLRILKFGILSLAVLTLSSCTIGNSSNEVSPTPEPQFEKTNVTIVESDRPFDFSDNGKFILENATHGFVVLGGSGSCPPIIKNAEYKANTLTVNIDKDAYPEDQVCTTDFRLYVFDATLTTGEFLVTMNAVVVNGENKSELLVISQ